MQTVQHMFSPILSQGQGLALGDLSEFLTLIQNQSFELPHPCLIWFQDGSVEFLLEQGSLRLQSPTLLALRKGRCLRVQGQSSEVKGYVLYFREEFFSLLGSDRNLRDFSFFQPDASGAFPRLDKEQNAMLAQLWASLEKEHEGLNRGPVLRSYLNILFYEISEWYEAVPVRKLHEKITAFQNLLERDFRKQRLPSYYAKQLHLTENHLNRLCKRELGDTVGACIRERVFTEACRLLLHTQYSVAELAYMLGFESASYFSTFFKRMAKQTPENFREA